MAGTVAQRETGEMASRWLLGVGTTLFVVVELLAATSHDVDQSIGLPPYTGLAVAGLLILAGLVVRWSGRFMSPRASTRLSTGTANHFVTADELASHLSDGIDSCPEGVAVVWAVVDWRRVGETSALSEASMRDLGGVYYDRLCPGEPWSEELFQKGVAWATGADGDALITAEHNGQAIGYRVFDYILEFFEEHGQEIDPDCTVIPGATWQLAIRNASPEEALAIGLSANIRYAHEYEEQAYGKAINGSNSVASRALYNWASMLAERGDTETSESLYRQAIEVDEAEIGALARCDLALLEQRKGNLRAAEGLLHQALSTNQPAVQARAANTLGTLYEAQGRFEEAVNVFGAIVDSPEEEIRLVAAMNLKRALARMQAAHEQAEAMRNAMRSDAHAGIMERQR